MSSSPTRLGTRLFDWKSQNEFAVFSGDFNPLHMDPVAARRTQAGRPVVHGVHAAIWALDVLARQQALQLPIARIKVRFHKWIYVGEEVAVELESQDDAGIRCRLSVDGLGVASLEISFGDAKVAVARENSPETVPAPSWPEEPVNLSVEQIRAASGWLAFAQDTDAANTCFAAVAAAIGSMRVAGLACMSRLVGMVCPGLYSSFTGFTVDAVEPAVRPDAMYFQVAKLHERFRLVTESVEGGGWHGVIECAARIPPVSQALMQDFADSVRDQEFQHASALIVGGSRGLGELAAKLIAAGGGEVTITYAVGLAEAQDVQRQIREQSGKCEILQYDATMPVAGQLSQLKHIPTSLYYFATPMIFRRKKNEYAQSDFNDFLRVYVDGFHGLVQELLRTSGAALTAFYPSSVAVEARPEGMTEYAMAKAAGEVLCADLERFNERLRVVVERLPRMLTDQTASATPVKTATPVDTMLRIVRQVETAEK
jgi:NAD(P)-dependent dehydrogenase (short-subunit alcohol dehydrogenase family)